MFDLLSDLTAIPGVSGAEKPVREFIISRLRLGKNSRTDNVGNLIAEIGSGSPHVALVAHMDEVGLIITRIEEDGSLRFKKSGGIDNRILLSRKVQIQTSKGPVNGVIGLKPPQLVIDPEEMNKVIPAEKMHIDVGTRSRKESEKLGVRLLDTVTLEKGLVMLGKDLVVGRGLDDRVGCAILMKIYEQLGTRKTKGKISCVWSVQEELGLRGAKVVSHTIKPDFVIVLDPCSSGDSPGVDHENLQPAMLGEGPVLRYRDAQSVTSPKLREMANEIAKSKKIPLQEIWGGGSNDSVAIQESGSAVTTIAVGMRNTHSTTETVSLKDIENAVRLIVELVVRLGNEKAN